MVPLPPQAALSWWSEVSPYSGWGSTLALLFVLVVAGIKALWEDRKRHQEDRETNNSVTHVMQPDGEPEIHRPTPKQTGPDRQRLLFPPP